MPKTLAPQGTREIKFKENFKNTDEVVESYFGTWIDKLFGGAEYWNNSNTFYKQKESFFYLLKKLLDDGKVVFFPPEKNSKIRLYKYISDGEEYEEELWDETPENIILYIKDIFPKNVTDENDLKLNDFWYSACPEIGWIDQDTREIVAS